MHFSPNIFFWGKMIMTIFITFHKNWVFNRTSQCESVTHKPSCDFCIRNAQDDDHSPLMFRGSTTLSCETLKATWSPQCWGGLGYKPMFPEFSPSLPSKVQSSDFTPLCLPTPIIFTPQTQFGMSAPILVSAVKYISLETNTHVPKYATQLLSAL